MCEMIIEAQETETVIQLFKHFYYPDDDGVCESRVLLEDDILLIIHFQTDALSSLHDIQENTEWYEFPFLFHYAMRVVRTILDKIGSYCIDAIRLLDFQGSVLIEY